eukprot:CAMPEP_0183552880 /NCGR_PEP_ID=MMETSP0371-20130417/71976_1 /TAXON_ID=268820 /ORGANISM="Peridinium aciculiferum, Strain PAER-2" /LENGTH=48 /DNA_ID= /DNA_START= /DNA_END= /DNA_ORIENTATION=
MTMVQRRRGPPVRAVRRAMCDVRQGAAKIMPLPPRQRERILHRIALLH